MTDFNKIHNPDDSEIRRYPTPENPAVRRTVEDIAHKILIHTNPGFEKKVHGYINELIEASKKL